MTILITLIIQGASTKFVAKKLNLLIEDNKVASETDAL